MLNVELMIKALAFEQEQARRRQMEEGRIWRELDTQRLPNGTWASQRTVVMRKPNLSGLRAWFARAWTFQRRPCEPRTAATIEALMEVQGERKAL